VGFPMTHLLSNPHSIFLPALGETNRIRNKCL
jgi:hypothetical protein